MQTTKQTQCKRYNVGEESRRFLYALDTFERFESVFFDALCKQYGEEAGERFYHEHDEQLEAVERIIMEYLRIQFTQGMGTDAVEVTI